MFFVLFRRNLFAIKRISRHSDSHVILAINGITRACDDRLYATAQSLPAKPSVTTAQPIGKRRFRRPVESDVHKIVNYCMGANYFVEGEDVKLKDDSEYPEWLWTMPLKPPRVEDLDPNTKAYWEKLHKYGIQRRNAIMGNLQKRHMIVADHIKLVEELKYRRRYRALTKKEGFDAGFEVIKHVDREDHKDISKREELRLPDDPKPFYPGIDQLNLPYDIANSYLRLRKQKIVVGRFKC